MMKKIVFLFFALFPLVAVAQGSAEALLEKAVAVIKSDAAVQMDYDYTVYDDDGVIVYSDNGTMTDYCADDLKKGIEIKLDKHESKILLYMY